MKLAFKGSTNGICPVTKKKHLTQFHGYSHKNTDEMGK